MTVAPNRPKAQFKALVRAWGEKLNVEIIGLYVRPMRNKWASCSSNGILSFNDELLKFEPDVWNYVIVHELLHFDVPNHGKLWKSLMRAHVGDWERCEEFLRIQAEKTGKSFAKPRYKTQPNNAQKHCIEILHDAIHLDTFIHSCFKLAKRL